MLKVKISIDDGKGKKAEIELAESDNQLNKLAIIHNVFNIFGVDTDIISMAETYKKIGEAYSSFFDNVDPIETSPKITIPEATNVIKLSEMEKQYSDGLADQELLSAYKSTEDQPDFLITGIKQKDGTKLYRLRYVCTACSNRGNHYVYENSKGTWCHRCNHKMFVYPAHPEGFPNRDSIGNFFRAGVFKDSSLDWTK